MQYVTPRDAPMSESCLRDHKAHIATHCNTLQDTASHCTIIHHTPCHILRHTAPHYTMHLGSTCGVLVDEQDQGYIRNGLICLFCIHHSYHAHMNGSSKTRNRAKHTLSQDKSMRLTHIQKTRHLRNSIFSGTPMRLVGNQSSTIHTLPKKKKELGMQCQLHFDMYEMNQYKTEIDR